MKTESSKALFDAAQHVIPGGVNSPVRAFKSVGGQPLFIKKADGAYLTDQDGNDYIELINSWGPMLFGHNHPHICCAVSNAIENSLSFGAPNAAEVKMAEKIVEFVPSIEKVRMVNSGTEATMSAIRLARGFTKKEKIIKLTGCYHGHGDSFLIAAGSGALTTGVPDSAGVTWGAAKDTLLADFNNIDQVEALTRQHPGEIAALILEPVAGNMGCVLPNPGYLEALRQICDREQIVLIFDEVMTGFRLAKGGAQELFGVMPDLTTLGKIIGGGMPVGAFGGKSEIMDCISPVGDVYQAGTLSGNPVAMAAGLAMLELIEQNSSSLYQDLERITTHIVNSIQSFIDQHQLPCTLNQVGSMYSLFFTSQKVVDFESAKSTDLEKFKQYFQLMLNLGIYLAPSQFESLFISTAITDQLADKIISSNEKALGLVFELETSQPA